MSPLLANILLNQLDHELHRRGHRFARYADDLVILIKSERAAQRIMRSTTRYLETVLKLKVNSAKSRVAPMSECSFLSFTIKGKKIRWTDKALPGFKRRVKELMGRSWGVSMAYRLHRPRQHQELLAHGENPSGAAGTVQCVADGAGLGQREGSVVQVAGLHGREGLKRNFIKRADLLNRPLRTRMVGGVGAGS